MLVAAGLVLATGTNASAFFAQENSCLSKLGKAIAKVNKIAYKAHAKCLDKEIAGKGSLPCPSVADAVKIQKAIDKAISAGEKSCASTCSVSGVPCVTDRTCPPNLGSVELCTGGVKGIRFDIDNIGFPGPFCESAVFLNRPIDTGADLGECAGLLASATSTNAINAVYGNITSASLISTTAAKCLATASKAVAKLVSTAAKGILKCRDAVNKGGAGIALTACATDDAKLAAKIAKAETKLSVLMGKKCIDDDIAELELCNGTATTIAEAVACLTAGAREVAESGLQSAERSFSPVSLVEAAYPPTPSCGDGVANQVQNAFQLLGEECDGDDDSACPGECGAAGDIFQCTCLNIPRARSFADASTSDLDNGWTGKNHNSNIMHGAGFFTERQNCDCDAFDTTITCSGGARTTVCTTNADCELIDEGTCTLRSTTCTGSSSDQICDTPGDTLPVCAFNPSATVSCDQFGNFNGENTDGDCTYCDAFNTNPFTSCTDPSDCQAQCYDALGTPVGLCAQQSDCGAGERCQGTCLASECLILPNGAPIPLSAGGTAVCVITTFVADSVGTQDIVTGDAAVFIDQNSKVHLGLTNQVPCPVCGGFCSSGDRVGDICEGTCSTSGDDCRFDTDCPSGETCTDVSAACPNGVCNLSLICGGGGLGGLNNGLGCRIEAASDVFGTVSSDCPPDNNISGKGLAIKFFPSTTGETAHANIEPCEALGAENYQCPCVGGGVPGRPVAPNDCTAVCNAGPEFGTPCGFGTDNKNGFSTVCVGGSNPGTNCQTDAHCNGGTCSGNPTHCVGEIDPEFAFDICTTNADCNIGTCENACPSGRCTQLCLPETDPFFGALGGTDPTEGLCVVRDLFHCSGEKFQFLTCTRADAEAGCNATCSTSGTPCNEHSQCPSGETCTGDCDVARLCGAGSDNVLGNANDQPGGGICVVDKTACYITDVENTCTVLPGDPVGSGRFPCTLDTDCPDFPTRICDGPVAAAAGEGIPSPTNPQTVATFCIPRTNNSSVNTVAGLGGPGRLTQDNVVVPNFDCLGVTCP